MTCGVKGSSEPAVAGLHAPHAYGSAEVDTASALERSLPEGVLRCTLAPPCMKILKDSTAGRVAANGAGAGANTRPRHAAHVRTRCAERARGRTGSGA